VLLCAAPICEWLSREAGARRRRSVAGFVGEPLAKIDDQVLGGRIRDLRDVLQQVDGTAIGNLSAIAISRSLAALTRFAPFSYFCNCWNVTPRRSARSSCDMPRESRWARILFPISTSYAPLLRAITFCISSKPASFELMSCPGVTTLRGIDDDPHLTTVRLYCVHHFEPKAFVQTIAVFLENY
jgi:hypothetical protein